MIAAVDQGGRPRCRTERPRRAHHLAPDHRSDIRRNTEPDPQHRRPNRPAPLEHHRRNPVPSARAADHPGPRGSHPYPATPGMPRRVVGIQTNTVPQAELHDVVANIAISDTVKIRKPCEDLPPCNHPTSDRGRTWSWSGPASNTTSLPRSSPRPSTPSTTRLRSPAFCTPFSSREESPWRIHGFRRSST